MDLTFWRKMTQLNNLVIIPDGNRRYERRQYATTIMSRDGNLVALSLTPEITEHLECRIRQFLATQRDSFYDSDGVIDHFKNTPTEPTFLIEAYKKSADNMDSILRYILDNVLTKSFSIYGLQPGNFERKAEEIDAILKAEIDKFNEWLMDTQLLGNVKFKFVGDLKLFEKHRLGQTYIESARKLEALSYGQILNVFILAPYHYSWEINQAIVDGVFDESRLIVPSLDLVVRTADEKRISEVVPIQARNAEYVFRKEYFPDFTVREFQEVLAEFSKRQRRFGR